MMKKTAHGARRKVHDRTPNFNGSVTEVTYDNKHV